MASVIEFSMGSPFSVGSPFVTFFLILLQYNIWPLQGLVNWDICEADFAVRVTLRRHIKTDHECNYDVCTKRI